MGWLLGIGAVAAVIGGVWYWRSRRREKWIRRLECAIANMRAYLQPLRLNPAADPANVARLEGEIQILENYLREARNGGEPPESGELTLTDWCPQA